MQSAYIYTRTYTYMRTDTHMHHFCVIAFIFSPSYFLSRYAFFVMGHDRQILGFGGVVIRTGQGQGVAEHA
jgi:hypothetical protein